MQVEKCKWKYGKQAPVMLMIDDFANKYMTDKENGEYIGADWGGKCKGKYSLYQYLEKNLFQDFPYLKVTMFLVVGRREKFIANGKPSFSESVAYNKEFSDFLAEIAGDERFEIAYHGYTHGKIIEKYLTQEWLTFATLEEACETIKKAQELYYSVTGKHFYGGKYCGYEFNEFSDTSIAKTGFEWWCRHGDGIVLFKKATGVENLELEAFRGGVVDIPTTVDGSLFSLRDIRGIGNRGYLKAIYYLLKYRITIEQILDRLVQNGQIINIQEHSSPIREDEKHQRPNIVDDITSIRYMLRYLKKYDLWYATGHEIAEYWKTYQNTSVSVENDQVIVTAKLESLGKTLWFALSEPNEGAEKHFCLRSELGEIIQGTKTGDRFLFGLKLTKERERFTFITL